MPKPLTVWITTNCGKFWKIWEYEITWPTSSKTCMPVKKQQLKPNMEKWTGSKLGNEYIKAVYCHPAYLTYIQSTSCKMPGWMKHKLESRLPDQISHSVVSDSLRPHESQHARPSCPSPTPRVHSDSRPSSQRSIQPSHPLSSPSPPAPNPSQHQSLFQWVNSSHEVAKVLEFQL